MLTSWSMRPILADSAQSAMRQIRAAREAGRTVRVAVIDYVMPDRDGFSLAEEIRNEADLADLKIIILSSAGHQARRRCQELRLPVCLEKPVFQTDLLQALAQVLGHSVVSGPEPGSATVEDSVEGETTGQRLNVLVAEDTPANQKLLQLVLQMRGHHVKLASDGAETLQFLKDLDFDVIVMDVEMPEVDGFQATRAIREMTDVRKARLPIIAMTAHAMKGDRERCLAAGMNAYLTKPVNREQLIRLVESLGRAEEAAIVTSSTPEPHRTVGGAAFDLDQAVRRCFGQYAMFQQMAGYFFGECDRLLLEMQHSCESGEAEALAKAAHRLKGTVFYLASDPVLECVRAVEQCASEGELDRAAAAVAELGERIILLKEALAEHRATPAKP